jgi:exopolysaccharide production protein ExoZ
MDAASDAADRVRELPAMRLDSVQMLRALAALAVFTHHIRMLANGAWGVDLFFVISGFIMCYVTERSGEHFFAKRLIRVVPLYWAGTIAVFCVALAMPDMLKNTTANLVDLAKSLAFIPFRKGTETTPVLFLGWTLNYEMFFYLIFALSMAASHKYRAVISAALLIVIVMLGQSLPIESVPLRFFSRPIILEFAYGMLCYALLMRSPMRASARRPVATRLPWMVAGALLIACMPLATLWSVRWDESIRWGIPAALAFYCVVYGLYGVRLPRGVVIIGDASYSLYLFHPYVIQIFTKAGAFSGGGALAYTMAAVAMGLCIGLSILSLNHLEKPTSDYLRRHIIDRPVQPIGA